MRIAGCDHEPGMEQRQDFVNEVEHRIAGEGACGGAFELLTACEAAPQDEPRRGRFDEPDAVAVAKDRGARDAAGERAILRVRALPERKERPARDRKMQ